MRDPREDGNAPSGRESAAGKPSPSMRQRLARSSERFLQSKPVRVFRRGMNCLLTEGPLATLKRVRILLRTKWTQNKVYSAALTPQELQRQRETRFPKSLRISLLVPLHNTPETALREMIRSVQQQTYENWELCLADGSDDQHQHVGRIAREFAESDSRILYRRLERNGGIAENTSTCAEMAHGEYLGLLDHDDLLHAAALHEVMAAICEQDADFLYTDEVIFHDSPEAADATCFKPDYSPDLLRSRNYIGHFTVFRRELLAEIGGFRPALEGNQHYDAILRLTEKARKISHIPKALYYWRRPEQTVADPAAVEAGRQALTEHLNRVGLRGQVLDSRVPATYRIQYAIGQDELISILIPNKDHADDLQKCVDSLRQLSTYRNWELIIIENNSTEKRTFRCYEELQKDSRIRVVTWEGEFNYSAINNYGRSFARGAYILLLNNDIEVIAPDWLEQMVMFAQREDVGAVGAMLYYPDDTVQHAGVILGIGGVAAHSHGGFPRASAGYMDRLTVAQNLTSVTAACLMTRAAVWDEMQGLDESFRVAFNDVDLCMRIRKAGYLIVWTPYAELYHYESKSRGMDTTPEKRRRFLGEVDRFQKRWVKELQAGDPYYNPNLTLRAGNFSIRS